jgi:ubiquitin C-terminal hydrolase
MTIYSNGDIANDVAEFHSYLVSTNKYKLKGAIIHSGSYYSGHYIYIGNINNTWYLFNDNIVSGSDGPLLSIITTREK